MIENEEVIDDKEEEDKEGRKAEDKPKESSFTQPEQHPARSSRGPPSRADYDLGDEGAAGHHFAFIRDE